MQQMDMAAVGTSVAQQAVDDQKSEKSIPGREPTFLSIDSSRENINNKDEGTSIRKIPIFICQI